VVIFSGLKAKQDEALKFNVTAKKGFYTVGDCTGRCGNIQKTTRSAFFMASQVKGFNGRKAWKPGGC
jgi:hypothetical protein